MAARTVAVFFMADLHSCDVSFVLHCGQAKG
jgi:hypothetical protein